MPAFRSNPRTQSAALESHVLRDNPRLAFDPRSLDAGLLVWARSDLGVEMNGSTASGWADMSGSGNDLAQATAADQPTLASGGLGGRPELTFDGLSDVLTGPSLYGMLSADDEWTVALIVRDWTWGATIGPTWGTAHGRAVMGAPSNGGSYLSLVVGNSSQGPTSGFYNGSARIATPPAAGSQGEDLIWVAVNDGGDFTTRINGSAGSTSGSSGGFSSNVTTLGIGHGTYQTTFWDGAISEVLIFDGALDEEELGDLEEYLSNRYGIQV